MSLCFFSTSHKLQTSYITKVPNFSSVFCYWKKGSFMSIVSRVTLPCSRHLSAVEEKHQTGLQICFARVMKNLGHVREDYGNAGDYGRSSLKMWRENQQRNSFRWWRWHSTGSARRQRLKVSTSRDHGLNLKPLLTVIAFSSYKKKELVNWYIKKNGFVGHCLIGAL